MLSYKEYIKDDNFHLDDEYFVDTNINKMCWGCETKHKSGHMVWDATKLRRFFLCEDCFKKLNE
ncbi:MAG: hypothetical protein EU532_03805 [Promethearchaeota archaeon]|nr:MAG: hypothetical protein EU532_03805 [Candidatus Lokiarchaeota archaeon]